MRQNDHQILDLWKVSCKIVEYWLRIKQKNYFLKILLGNSELNQPKTLSVLTHGLFSVFFQPTTNFEQNVKCESMINFMSVNQILPMKWESTGLTNNLPKL
jgi:hypothetical protein